MRADGHRKWSATIKLSDTQGANVGGEIDVLLDDPTGREHAPDLLADVKRIAIGEAKSLILHTPNGESAVVTIYKDIKWRGRMQDRSFRVYEYGGKFYVS